MPWRTKAVFRSQLSNFFLFTSVVQLILFSSDFVLCKIVGSPDYLGCLLEFEELRTRGMLLIRGVRRKGVLNEYWYRDVGT